MGDAAQEEASHCDVDHRLGDVEALLEVSDEAAPADQPAERALDDPPARQHLEPRFAIDAAHDLEDEVDERRLVEQLGAIVGAVSEQRLPIASRIACAPVLSAMSAVVRFTISRRPSVSMAMWRFRPTIFLLPRACAAGAFTIWLSMTAAVGLASRPMCSRSIMSATS